MSAKKTPLHDRHVELDAKMVDFAGFRMPVMYNSINAEHLLVRNNAGIFDLSHMGEFEVSGSDALEFLQRVTVNDVSALEEWQVQYTCMCYQDGGIVDDLLIYRLPDRYMLVVNAACIEKDFEWLEANQSGDVRLVDVSDDFGLIAVQGVNAQKFLSQLTESDLDSIKFYWSTRTAVAGSDMLISRTGYTGEDGFEMYISANECILVWDRIMEFARESAVGPVGLGARDSLRLEMKYMLYGNDIDKTTNPIAAGLGWIVKLEKGDFIGRDAILRVKEEKPSSRLIAFEMLDRAFPRPGYDLVGDGRIIGRVTSGGYSPSLEKGIGLGYVRRGRTKAGTEIKVDIRGTAKAAVVVKPPFYKHGSHR
jgi:aminomethyltransferase